MDAKLRFSANERLDLPDATAIHDLVDASFRATGRIVGAPGPGLTLSGAYDPPGVVVSGWTVRVNPVDDQQLLITPGVAYCAQMVDGVASFGQLTAPSATEITYTLSAPLQVYGVWVRFDFTGGATDNRAFWNLASSPPAETVQPVQTRQVATAYVSKSAVASAPDANGWFKICDVDYTSGAITAGAITDTRTLAFEGQGSGSANPSTTWDVPDFNRGNSRGIVGARSVFGALMRIYRRLLELAGRTRWYDGPTYGENVRSASAQITAGGSTEVPHVTLGASPTVAELSALLSGENQPDQRGGVSLIPSLSAANAAYSVDTTGGPIVLAAGKRMQITASATISRTGGTLGLVETQGFDGTITGLDLRSAGGAGAAVLRLNGAGDDINFVGCVFSATSGAQGVLVEILAAGRYIFTNCNFVANNATTTELVRVAQAATVVFAGCTFTSGLLGINVPSAGKDATVTVLGGLFDGVGTVFRDETGDANLNWYGIGVDNTVTADTSIPGVTNFAPDAMNRSSRTARNTVGRSLWAMGDEVRFGNGADPAYIKTTRALPGQLTGVKANAGGIIDAVFGTVFTDVGRVVFGDGGSTIDNRWQLVSGAMSLLDSASTDVATNIFAHLRAVHFGSKALAWNRMGNQQVPMAWFEIRYSSGDGPTNFSALLHNKDGVTDLQASGGAVLSFVGSNNYHQWVVDVFPAPEGVQSTGGLNNYIVVTDLTNTGLPAVGGYTPNANGTLPHRASVFASYSTNHTVTLWPILVNTAGAQVGFRSVDPAGGDYDFTPADVGMYIIKGLIFADPSKVI